MCMEIPIFSFNCDCEYCWMDDWRALVRLTSRSFRAWDFHGGDLIKYPLCGMNFAELSACVDSAKWLSSQIIK